MRWSSEVTSWVHLEALENRKLDMLASVLHTLDGTNPAAAWKQLEFGRFQVLRRQRLLLADGVPIELGTRAFEVLLVLLEADGGLITKEELLARVWHGAVVAEDNLKAQVFALRRAFGDDRDLIRTDFGRGYRFTAAVRSVGRSRCQPAMPRCYWPTGESFSRRGTRRPSHGWIAAHSFGRERDASQGVGGASSGGEAASGQGAEPKR
jgi:DNA-binding winged helix-turn-helix (wHTH) protein